MFDAIDQLRTRDPQARLAGNLAFAQQLSAGTGDVVFVVRAGESGVSIEFKPPKGGREVLGKFLGGAVVPEIRAKKAGAA